MSTFFYNDLLFLIIDIILTVDPNLLTFNKVTFSLLSLKMKTLLVEAYNRTVDKKIFGKNLHIELQFLIITKFGGFYFMIGHFLVIPDSSFKIALFHRNLEMLRA